MRLIHTCALSTVAALGLSFALAAPADARKKKAPKKQASCAMVTGEGTGITAALARTNAANSLDTVAARVGGKRTGKVTTKCTASLGGVVNTCQSSQRVCK